ncbi:MAG TPA: hypothetical protein PKD86_14835 [Gemmatales bacterium]|nr:hypothetical protein [Gemmatales bacterium]
MSESHPEQQGFGMGGFLRFILGVFGLGILGIGSYYAIDVVHAGSAVIQNPRQLENGHKAFCELMQIERLGLRVQDQDVNAGATMALGAMWGWYALWALIPVWIMGAGARIVVASLSRGR